MLQENDGTAGQNGGVTSSALWDSLKTACQQMRRVDLAALCDRKDLDGERVHESSSITRFMNFGQAFAQLSLKPGRLDSDADNFRCSAVRWYW